MTSIDKDQAPSFLRVFSSPPSVRRQCQVLHTRGWEQSFRGSRIDDAFRASLSPLDFSQRNYKQLSRLVSAGICIASEKSAPGYQSTQNFGLATRVPTYREDRVIITIVFLALQLWWPNCCI